MILIISDLLQLYRCYISLLNHVWLILLYHFRGHINQFGFVKHGGCDKTLFAVKSDISYFFSHISPVFVCSFDAEKAFDCINHYGLLHTLIERRMPKSIIMLLLTCFSLMYFCVQWERKLSSLHHVLSGLLQGNLFSSRFLCVN